MKNLNHYVVHLKLIKFCKSTIPQFKKRFWCFTPGNLIPPWIFRESCPNFQAPQSKLGAIRTWHLCFMDSLSSNKKLVTSLG